MSGYTSNSSLYNIHSESEAQKIFSHFNSDQIVDFIEDSLNKRWSSYMFPLPNIINALEQDFKNTAFIYPEKTTELNEIREGAYRRVIQLIATNNKLNVAIDQNMDFFSMTYYLYDMFVSNFTQNIALFFTSYIVRERNSLYNYLELDEMKKNRDSSTIYGKKMYKNSKMAVINANLEFVINSICGFDMSFETLLSFICPDQNVINYITSFVSPTTDFFKDIYVNALSIPELRYHVLTSIRLQIHSYASEE